MIIGKYDIAQGSGSNASVGSTAVAGGGGGGASIDITPITDKIALLEAKVSQLETQLARVQATLSGLDSRFLSKFGDRSEYSYALGAVYTDFIQSEMYDNGVGYRVSGSPTAAIEDKYNLIIKDVGWARIPFNTIQQSEVTLVTTNTDEETDQLNVNNVSIGPTIASGYMLIDCGATLTQERCFTVVNKTVQYNVKKELNGRVSESGFKEAQTDSSGYFILKFDKADNISFDIRFRWTYAFRKYGDMTSGSYRLFIRGTDYADSETDCFAASVKTTTVNSSGITVMQSLDGARLTSDGLETTTDGGVTWH